MLCRTARHPSASHRTIESRVRWPGGVAGLLFALSIAFGDRVYA